MSRGNRALAAKNERAQRERRDFAKAVAALEAVKPLHAAKVTPILNEHWGRETLTAEDIARLTAEYLTRRNIRKCPTAPRNERDCTVGKVHLERHTVSDAKRKSDRANAAVARVAFDVANGRPLVVPKTPRRIMVK